LKYFRDEEVNFAIQKGLQASKAELVYFRHNCPEDLERLILEKNSTVSNLAERTLENYNILRNFCI